MATRILYIEDNPFNIDLVKKMIRVMNYQLDFAVTGTEGLLMTRNTPYDLILLDINLPDIDGLEVFRQLRENPVTEKVPVVALTADTMNFRACHTAGFDGYVNKPVSRGTLLRTVQQFLSVNA